METRTTSVPHGATSNAGIAGAQVQEVAPRHSKTNGHSKGKGAARAVASIAAVVAEQPMTATEKTELHKLESVIEKGLQTFLDVGNALLSIRDQRLYRGTHTAFDAYCRERWNFSKTQANRFIAASEVAKNLAPIGVTPRSESQVRLLSSLPAEKQVKVFERAAKTAGGAEKVTAQSIEKAAVAMKLKTRSQASAASRDDKNVDRADVVAAFQEWAEANWERVSQMSVADFMKEVKKVVKDA
jgi:hypothetical protein